MSHRRPFALDASLLEGLQSLCRKFHVRRLDLFGSAVGKRFDDAESDIDLLVDFDDLPPAAYTEAYFGLHEGLVELFERDIDLVSERAIENPYLRRQVERQRQTVYAAA